jgi:hypothetical protein
MIENEIEHFTGLARRIVDGRTDIQYHWLE